MLNERFDFFTSCHAHSVVRPLVSTVFMVGLQIAEVDNAHVWSALLEQVLWGDREDAVCFSLSRARVGKRTKRARQSHRPLLGSRRTTRKNNPPFQHHHHHVAFASFWTARFLIC